MFSYILKRVFWSIPVLFSVSLITFFLMHLVPGGPWDGKHSDRPISKNTQQALAEKYGLDKPLIEQYINYIGSAILRGDMGISYDDPRPVTRIIAQEFPISAAFGSVALIIGVIIGIPIGLISALHRNSVLDRTITIVITIIISLPSFVVAIILILTVALQFHLTSVQFYRDHWQSWMIPLGLLTIRIFALVVRLMRPGTLDILGSDYIRTAHMKGLPNYLINSRHILRNAVLPIITLLGPLAADVLTGSFVIESIFGIPGIGRTFISSVLNRDYTLLMGTTLFFAFILILFNLLVDISYAAIDPRITYH
jgi:oligopeptide transport system permease protein